MDNSIGMHIGNGSMLHPGYPTLLEGLWGWFNAENVALDQQGLVERLNLVAGRGADLVQNQQDRRAEYTNSGLNGLPEIISQPAANGDTEGDTYPIGLTGSTGQTHTIVFRNLNGNEGSFYQWNSTSLFKTSAGGVDWSCDENATDRTILSSHNGDYQVVTAAFTDATELSFYVNGSTASTNQTIDPEDDGIIGETPQIFSGLTGEDHAVRALVINEVLLSENQIINLHSYLLGDWV